MRAMTIEGSGATVRMILQWAEPWSGVATDLDMYLLNSAGNAIVASSAAGNVSNSQTPFEIFNTFQNAGATGTFQLVIGRYTGAGGGGTATPRVKVALAENGDQDNFPTEYTVSAGGDTVGPTIFGHNGSANGSSVAAVPFNDSTTAEQFSSRGPVTHYFGPVSGTTPAAALGSPSVLAKPDIAATDGGLTTFFGPGNRFFGTSAAAPHAGAVGALQQQANPTLTPAQIRALQAASGRAVGAFGPSAIGAGLLDALAAGPPPNVTLTGPGSLTNNRRPVISFSTTQTATFTCATDGAAAQACSSPFTVLQLADGQHTFTVTATNANADQGTGSVTFTVDGTPPSASVTGGPRATQQRRPTFRFSANEAATFQCKLDSAAFGPCTGATSHRPAAPLRDGNHTFSVRATDPATNVGAAANRKFKVDNKKPAVSIRKHPRKRTRKARAKFTFKANEPVKFKCKLDGGGFKSCGRSKTVRVARGKHKFTVRGTDAAGNAGSASFSWRRR